MMATRPAPWAMATGSLPEDVPTAALAYEARRLLAAARLAGDRVAELAALTDLGAMAARPPEPRSALAPLGEAIRLAVALGERAREGEALGFLGLAWLNAGEPTNALEPLARSMEIARSSEDPHAESTACYRLALALACHGLAADAGALLDRGIELARSAGSPNQEALQLWSRAICHDELYRRSRGGRAGGGEAVERLREAGFPEAPW